MLVPSGDHLQRRCQNDGKRELDKGLAPNETVIVSDVFQAIVIILGQVLHYASFEDRIR